MQISYVLVRISFSRVELYLTHCIYYRDQLPTTQNQSSVSVFEFDFSHLLILRYCIFH